MRLEGNRRTCFCPGRASILMEDTGSHCILWHGISAMKGGAGGGEGAKEAGVTDKQSVIRMGLSCRTACPLEVSHSELPAFL